MTGNNNKKQEMRLFCNILHTPHAITAWESTMLFLAPGEGLDSTCKTEFHSPFGAPLE